MDSRWVGDETRGRTTMTQGLNRAQSSEQKQEQNRNNDQWAVRDRLELRITHLSDVCIE